MQKLKHEDKVRLYVALGELHTNQLQREVRCKGTDNDDLFINKLKLEMVAAGLLELLDVNWHQLLARLEDSEHKDGWGELV